MAESFELRPADDHDNMDREAEEQDELNIEEGRRTNEEDNSNCCPTCQSMHEFLAEWMLPDKESHGKYLERANCLPPPIFIIIISIVELGVFTYYAIWKPQKQWITLDNGVWNSPFIYRPDLRQEAWRFVSYMLVHAGVQHILNNVVVQLVLGLALELVHKGHRVAIVYLSGVIAGSLGSSIFDPEVALVGASGGVYALIGGYFTNVLVNFDQMKPLFRAIRIAFISVMVISDVSLAIYRRYIIKDLAERVSFVAHIAGGLAGLSMGYVVFSSYDKELLKDPRFWMCIVVYIACALVAVAYNLWLSPAN
uniref:rhomboid-related protein 2 n=1 Tax=Myxine glutinosa TaxID=7769 RepID=UPI00358DFECA